MAQKGFDDLGPLQQAIIQAIWEHDHATVYEVLDRLNENRKKPLVYTSVLSIMQRLEKLGWLKHRREGRNYVYSVTRGREQETRRSLRGFIDRVFGGDSRLLLQYFIEDQELDDEDLRELTKMINAKRKKKSNVSHSP